MITSKFVSPPMDAEIDDIPLFIPRPEDAAEWLAAGSKSFARDLAEHITFSKPRRVIFDVEYLRPICFYGVRPKDTPHPRQGVVWLVAAPAAVGLALEIHRWLKPEVELLHSHYDYLLAYADARNTVHHTWMEWLGMKRLGERVIMDNGDHTKPFYAYTWDLKGIAENDKETSFKVQGTQPTLQQGHADDDTKG